MLAAALLALAAWPAAAGAHAVVSLDGATILYSAPDAGQRSTATITAGTSTVRITDTTVDGGIDPGRCDPGEVGRSGFIIEVVCPRNADTRVRASVGPADDDVEVREAAGAAPLATLVLGGTGADRLVGGEGPDVLDGGAGGDRLEGRGGDDELRARDGAVEVAACGAGTDRAFLDETDLPDACEAVDYTDPPAPPPEEEPGPPAASDTTPPAIEGRAARVQRVGRRAALVVHAATDEVAQLSASATIRAGRRRLVLTARQRRAETPGERVRLVLRGTASATRALRRALAGRRRLSAAITIVAIDDAGNSGATRLPRVRLRR